MYGEVYQSISGVNLMADGDTGIHGSAATGQGTGAISLRWTENGIINTGTFGYALGGYNDAYTGQADYQALVDAGYDNENAINQLMRDYISRVLQLDKDSTGGWNPFYNYFGPTGHGCVSVL